MKIKIIITICNDQKKKSLILVNTLKYLFFFFVKTKNVVFIMRRTRSTIVCSFFFIHFCTICKSHTVNDLGWPILYIRYNSCERIIFFHVFAVQQICVPRVRVNICSLYVYMYTRYILDLIQIHDIIVWWLREKM